MSATTAEKGGQEDVSQISRVDLMIPVLRAEAGIVARAFALRDLLEAKHIDTTINIDVLCPDDWVWENRYQLFVRLEMSDGSHAIPNDDFFKEIFKPEVVDGMNIAFRELAPEHLFLEDVDHPRRSFDKVWDDLKKIGSFALRAYGKESKWDHPDCVEFDKEKAEFIDWFSGWVHTRLIRAGLIES